MTRPTTAPTRRVGEPALIVGLIASFLDVIVALNWHGLSSTQAALIVAAVSAVGGLIVAVRTRPWAPAAFTAVVSAVAALLAGYGYHAPPALVGAISGLVLAVLSLVTRHQVSPVGRVL